MKTYYNLVIGCIICGHQLVMLLARFFAFAADGETCASIPFLIAACRFPDLFLARLMKTNSKKSALKQALQWLIAIGPIYPDSLGTEKIANYWQHPASRRYFFFIGLCTSGVFDKKVTRATSFHFN